MTDVFGRDTKRQGLMVRHHGAPVTVMQAPLTLTLSPGERGLVSGASGQNRVPRTSAGQLARLLDCSIAGGLGG